MHFRTSHILLLNDRERQLYFVFQLYVDARCVQRVRQSFSSVREPLEQFAMLSIDGPVRLDETVPCDAHELISGSTYQIGKSTRELSEISHDRFLVGLAYINI